MKPITIQSLINAPIEKVWRLWTKAEHITQWNFAHESWCCPRATNEVRPGGQLNWRMESKDGKMGFDFTGTYQEVVHHEAISYVISDGRKVRITFRANGPTVLLSESFEPESINDPELQEQGWAAILNNFKKYAENIA